MEEGLEPETDRNAGAEIEIYMWNNVCKVEFPASRSWTVGVELVAKNHVVNLRLVKLVRSQRHAFCTMK